MLQAQNNCLNINNLRQHNSDHRKLWAAASDVSCAGPPPKLRNLMRLMQSTSRTTTCILSFSHTQTKWLQHACERATDRDLGAMDGPIIISPPTTTRVAARHNNAACLSRIPFIHRLPQPLPFIHSLVFRLSWQVDPGTSLPQLNMLLQFNRHY